jgi:septal ring factor EnvC (AmiA/AmiB activator)
MSRSTDHAVSQTRRPASSRARGGVPLSLVLVGALLFLPWLVQPGQAQDPAELRREIQESQRRLEQIREERAQLQRDMEALRARVRDVSSELRNIEQQLSTSRSALAEIELQVEAATAQVQGTTRELLQAREQHRERQAILNRRLRDIYMQGPLHTVRVLLGADSFSDLLNRYHYLQLIAGYDRSLVTEVQNLEQELMTRHRQLQEALSELGRLREMQQAEVAELRQVEEEHQRALGQFRTRERQAQTRLEQLEEDSGRLTDLVADLERRRLEEERRRAMAGRSLTAPTLSTEDMGALEWPVEGEIAYRFGVDRRPNGTVLRWNGIGIRAPVGTPVRAVRDGEVVLAGPFEGYGPTLILNHGDGFYTLYLYLEDIGVVEGRLVSAGQVVGTVGGRGTPEGPHLEFQVRIPVAGGPPQAMDPLQWLRPRGGSR